MRQIHQEEEHQWMSRVRGQPWHQDQPILCWSQFREPGSEGFNPWRQLVSCVCQSWFSQLESWVAFISIDSLFSTGWVLMKVDPDIYWWLFLGKTEKKQQLKHFRGWCSIPYNEQQALAASIQDSDTADLDASIREILDSMASRLRGSSSSSESVPTPQASTFFDEELDLDMEYEEYEKIEVPDFSGGRRGRFIHDFSMVSICLFICLLSFIDTRVVVSLSTEYLIQFNMTFSNPLEYLLLFLCNPHTFLN